MPHPLKTILWKELRENWKWAALGALGLALAEVFALYQQRGGQGYLWNGFGLCTSDFLLVSVCGSILIGAALGALQIAPELDRDRWAALLHRPVPRSTIFLGKVLTGLMLYLLATSIPLLLSIACLTIPGQFPTPFLPGMIWPALSNVFLGVPFYALAVLVFLTRGRWFGRRMFLVFSVLPLLVIVLNTRWIFLPSACAAIVLLIAAWATMAGNGAARPGQKAAELSLGLLLYSGVAVALCFVVILVCLLAETTGGNSPQFGSRRFVLSKDGKVLLNHASSDYSGLTLTEADGSPVTDEKYRSDGASSYINYFQAICTNLNSPEEVHRASMAEDPHSIHNYARVAYGDGDAGLEYWFYLVGKNYFVGYDKATRLPIGICDRDGFHAADATPHPFPKPLLTPIVNRNPPVIAWMDNQLYAIDFADRSLRALFTAPSGPIHAAADIGHIYYAAFMDTTIQILDLQGLPIVTIPYAHDMAARAAISINTIGSGERLFVQYEPTEIFHAASGQPASISYSYVDEIDLLGYVLRTYSDGTPNPPPKRVGWPERSLLAVFPLLPSAIVTLATLSSSGPEVAAGNSSFGLVNQDESLLIPALYVFGFSLLAAAIAFLWARRSGFARADALRWSAFVFCFGLPSLIAFRLTAPFPTRVSCPSCSRKRSLQTEECPSCHQTWPTPSSNGTEIFAAL